jgi:hypothetical protein
MPTTMELLYLRLPPPVVDTTPGDELQYVRGIGHAAVDISAMVVQDFN